MSKNQNGENSMGGCEKIYKCFRRSHRDTHCPQNSNPTNAAASPLLPTPKAHMSQAIPVENRTTHEEVVIPIEVAPPVHPTLYKNRGQLVKVDLTSEPAPNSAFAKEDKVKNKAKKINEQAKVAPNREVAPNPIVVSTQDQQGDDNHKFSDYIKHAKMKIRTTTNVGHGKSVRRHDSFNDRVSNFINRAKIKIRSSSNIGEGKSSSFK